METITQDTEIEVETEGLLNLEGSAEGAQETLQSIEAAKDVTVDAFDQQDEQLETTQQDSEEYQTELEGRERSVEPTWRRSRIRWVGSRPGKGPTR